MENGIDPLEKGKRIVEKKSDAREREGGGGIDPSRFYAAFTLGGRIAVPPQGPTTSSPSNCGEGDELFYNGNRSKFALPVGGGGGSWDSSFQFPRALRFIPGEGVNFSRMIDRGG